MVSEPRLLRRRAQGATPGDASAAEGVGTPDGASFTELYRAHVQQVARWLRRLGVAPADVEDAAHDVFFVAFRRLGDYRPDRASFSTWLYGIAARTAATRRRSARWAAVASSALALLGLRSAGDRAAPAQAGSIAEVASAVEQRERAGRLRALIDELPEKQRIALLLFEVEGLSCDKIAAATGTSVGNVWVRIHRAKQTLKRRWRAEAERAGEGAS